MLTRVPEPELMDAPDQVAAYSDADFAIAHDTYVANTFAAVGPLTGTILDLGCGPADVTVRLARANPDATFVAIDAGPTMLSFAQARITAADLDDRIRLERRHLPDPTLPPAAFDGIVSNSVLHHLDDPLVLWETIAATGRRGAAIAVGDLLRPDSIEALEALVAEHTVGAPDVLRADFAHSLAAAYTLDEVADQLASVGLDLRVEATTDRHLLVSGRLP